MSEIFQGLDQPPPLPQAEFEVGGFLLSAETVQALEDLDVATLALADGSTRRGLLVERDGIAVDARLKEWLQATGMDLTAARGAGYQTMMAHPQTSRPPHELIERVTHWLDEASSISTPGMTRSDATSATGAAKSAQVPTGGSWVCGTPFTVDQRWGDFRASSPSRRAGECRASVRCC